MNIVDAAQAEPDGCSKHPKAKHGFARQASHSSDEHVCECAGFDPYDAGYQDGLRAAWDADGTLLPDGMVLVREPNVLSANSIDQLIAEIDGLVSYAHTEYGVTLDAEGDWIDADELYLILHKYRGRNEDSGQI